MVDYHKVCTTLWNEILFEYMECQVILWTAELPYGMQKYLVEFGISCVMQDKKAFEIKTTQWSS